jgi:predicted ATPase/DNA-binding SARP family transcriptional activator
VSVSEFEDSGSLKVQLLGHPRIERNGATVEVDTRKAVALLAYLAVTGKAYGREALATLFWPDYDQERAYANLRRTLWALNKAIGKEWLDVGQDSIGLGRGPGFSLDVDAFRQLLAVCRSHGHRQADVCPDCASALAGAADLYRGDFMEGFTLPDSPGFDEWQFFESEGLCRDLAWALEQLVRCHAAQREFGRAILFARRWLALDPLHEPARRELMALYAWDGQRAAALRQYDECSAALREELGATPEAETTRLYEAIRANRLPPPPARVAPAPAPAAERRAAAQPRHNLPPQPTPFVGRVAELAEIAARLYDPACRLLTLLGPGGAGKTRLAVESAHQVVDGQQDRIPFPDGVFFVPLAPVGAARYLVPALADALGFSFSRREGVEPEAQLVNYLRSKQALLILDNFEHLIEGAGWVSEVLEQAPDVKAMVTSRERLNIRWEWTLMVGGMEFPKDGEPAGPTRYAADATQYSAVQLFIQRARQADAGFVLAEADVPDVARICRLLDGLPLGIELAAAWVRMLSCREIADEIQRGPDLLSTTMRDIPDRHRSLSAVFDQSWQFLSEEERLALARLSVFRGGFDREAAEQVAGADIRVLSGLVDKSLLVRPQSGRYGFHEVIRQFAAARLDANPEERMEAQDRHCAYYAAFLERRQDDLLGERQLTALDEVGRDLENCRAAWQWAVERRKWRELRQAADAMHAFYGIRTLTPEGEDAFARAARALEVLRDEPGAAGEAGPGEIDRTLGLMLAYQALLASRLYRHEEATEAIRKSVELLKPWGMGPELAWANALSVDLGAQELGPEAESLVLDSLEALKRSNQKYLAGYVYMLLGNVAGALKDRPRAMRFAQEGLAFHQGRGDRWGIAFAEFSLGQLDQMAGARAEALEHYRRSLEMRRDLRDRWGISICLDYMGYVARELGNMQEARQLHLESLEVSRDIGDPLGIAGSLDNLGLIARDEGAYGEAERYFREGLGLRRQVGRIWDVAVSLRHMGDAALGQGDYEAAARWYTDSLHTYQGSPERFGIEAAVAGLGETSLAQGDTGEARRRFRTALRTAALAGDSSEMLKILVGISSLLVRTGHDEQAARVLAAVLHHPAGTWAMRARAERLLGELAARLPQETLALAQARGTGLDLDVIAEEVLEAL